MRYYWRSTMATRNSIAFAFIVCIVIVYVIWAASTTDPSSSFGASSSSAGNHFQANKAQRRHFESRSLQIGGHHHGSHMHAAASSTYLHSFMLTSLGLQRKRDASTAAASSSLVNDSMVVCSENFSDTRQFAQNQPLYDSDDLPTIYFVTPTYPRREQIPELTRLGQTLMHVPKIHWIVADDYVECNVFLSYLFNKFGIPFTHISSPMPDTYRSVEPSPRGVANRRAALNWLRNRKLNSGVLYFGDDDNTFDLKLFSEIRNTRKVSMFPVGLIGLFSVSTPVVRNGKVIGFFDSWPANRRWPVDMAGFAVNLEHLARHPNATMPYKAGYEEDSFLRSIALTINDIEPKANNCTEILVWHTQTQKTKAPVIRIDEEFLDDKSSLGALFKELDIMGVSHASDTDGVKATITRNGKSKPISYYLR